MKKKLTKLKTYEETLQLYSRYIDTCATRMNRDQIKDELIQEGSIGLFNAFNAYSEEKGPFHAYAQHYIKYAMLTYITNHSRTIRTPSHIQHIEKYKKEIIKTISTNTPLSNQEGDDTIEDTLSCNNYPTEYDNTNDFISDVLRHYLSQLSDRHQKLIILREIEEKTYLEIGNELGITREAVRQQYNNAMKKLRKLMGVEVNEKKNQG